MTIRLDSNANVDFRCYRVPDANIDIDYIASVSYRYRLEKKSSTTQGPRLNVSPKCISKFMDFFCCEQVFSHCKPLSHLKWNKISLLSNSQFFCNLENFLFLCFVSYIHPFISSIFFQVLQKYFKYLFCWSFSIEFVMFQTFE